MNLEAVSVELQVALKTITGLRVYLGYEGAIQVPAAVQYLPDRLEFDQSYGRGSDKITDHPVVVFVSKASLRTAVKNVTAYAAGSGAKSVKQKIEAYSYSNGVSVTVTRCEFDNGARVGNVDFLAALFYCTILGPGA